MSNANRAQRPKRKVLIEYHNTFDCPRSVSPDLWCRCVGGPVLTETWLPVTDKRRDAVAAALAVKWEALPADAVERIAKEVGL